MISNLLKKSSTSHQIQVLLQIININNISLLSNSSRMLQDPSRQITIPFFDSSNRNRFGQSSSMNDHSFWEEILMTNYIEFDRYSLRKIQTPSSVTLIGSYAFNKCSRLIQIRILSSITEIREFTFFGCSSLAQITISSSVTYIGDSTFSGCQIKIPLIIFDK